MNTLFDWLLPDGFMPHGHCYLWKPGVLWLHVGSDALIAGSYFAIPVALGYVVRKRGDALPYWWIAALFAAFIFLCGSTHLMNIWTVWHPDYVVDGLIKLATGIASAATALMTFAVLPQVLTLRTPIELQREVDVRTAELLALNEQLRAEIAVRKQVESDLAASRAELQFVTNSAAVMLAHCDRESRYLFVNRAYAERFRREPQELTGLRIAEVIGKEAYAAIEPFVRRALAGERVEFEVEIPYRTLDKHYMHSIYVPDSDATTGEVKGLVAAISDVTERHRLEEQLREADRRKDEFLAVLAHELRNPLAPILNAARLIKLAHTVDPRVSNARDIIDRQVHHMARLIDDLMDVSRITRGRLELRIETTDLARIVESAVETARPAINAKHHDLSIEMPAEPVHLPADPLRLAQVLTNLLTNAAKYTDSHGQIQLRVANDAERITISVSDNGIGIPPDELGHVFEMFSQVKSAKGRSEGGLGIGLAISQGLVELHGGTLVVHSAGSGYGSEFLISLPKKGALTDALRE